MIAFQRDIARVYAAIREADPGGVIDQFKSLTAANQYRKLYELTARYVPPDTTVLDWGCGRGHFAYFLAKEGFRVTAYSLEEIPEMFSTLSRTERDRLTFVRGEMDEPRKLPFSAGQFGAVFSVGVLEHVREMGGDELASLQEIRRVLAREGVFVCYHLPNRYSYIEAASRVINRPAPKTNPSDTFAFHEHRFTTRDVRGLCSAAGLSLVDIGRYGFVPRNSFNRLPRLLRESRALASAVNFSDVLLERLFSPIVQNRYFVARG